MRFISALRRKAVFFAALVLVAGFATSATAQDGSGYGSGATQGYIGQDPNAAPPVLPPGSVTSAQPTTSPAPPTLPPVFDTVRAAESQDNTQPAVADPCADFADSYDGYNMCQDRIKKIERMRDAKHRRMGTVPAIAPTAPEPEKPMTPEEAAAKVLELEKKMAEKEAEAEAKKAEPTTKKGIGAFERNPDKGNSVFK